MTKFELGKNRNRVLMTSFINAIIISANALSFSQSGANYTEDNTQKIISEFEAQAELENQLGDLVIVDGELDRIAKEEAEKEREEAIQKEAEEITEYYETAQEIVDSNVFIDRALNYDDPRRDDCEENYGDDIDRIAPKFGISPNIIRAIACQEGGGRLENVMQVDAGWIGSKIRYYDYDLNRWRKICITRQNKESTDDILYISKSDPNWSVYLGCALFQSGLQYNQGQLWLAFPHYNRGDATPLLNKAARDLGLTPQEYMDDKLNADIQYYEYNEYIQYVFQFMDEKPVEYSYYNEETGEIETYTIYVTYPNRDISDVLSDEIGDEPEVEYDENSYLVRNGSKVLQRTINNMNK